MAGTRSPSFLVTSFTAIALIATTQFASAETGRYTMTPTKDGILKLDTKTGSVALCSRSTGSWACKSVDGNDQGAQNRVMQLEKENARLRARLEQRSLAPAPEHDGKMEMPSEEDVDKAMDFMEKLLGRFKGMVEDLKKDKKEDDGVPL